MSDSVDAPYVAGSHKESARIFFSVGGKQLNAVETTGVGSQQAWFGSWLCHCLLSDPRQGC